MMYLSLSTGLTCYKHGLSHYIMTTVNAIVEDIKLVVFLSCCNPNNDFMMFTVAVHVCTLGNQNMAGKSCT